MKVAIFIERDGVLNWVRVDGNHQVSPLAASELNLNLDAVPHLQLLKDRGFLILVTTNQPGISRGYLCRSDLELMHRLVRAAFPVDDILVCPHDEFDRCPCRKPKPGLLHEAAFNWHLDLDRSYVISDKWQDAEAARLAGCTSLLIRSPWVGPVHHDFIVPTLPMAVGKILQLQQQAYIYSP